MGSPLLPILQVKDVIWLQKYPDFGTFSAIVTSSQLSSLTNPQPLAIA